MADGAEARSPWISLASLASFPACTRGSRRFGSAARFLDRSMFPRGREMDPGATGVDAATGDGFLKVRRGAETRRFVLDGSHAARLSGQ